MKNQPKDWMSAEEAARFLGVQLRTLYAYVSRGLVHSAPGEGRERRYARGDLERIKARSAARSGHGAVAAGALRWGEPVLESKITEIRPDGPRYRGHSSVELATRGVRFERVCALLWREQLDAELPRPRSVRARTGLDSKAASFLDRLVVRTVELSLADQDRFSSTDELELVRAVTLLEELALALACEKPAAGLSIAETVLTTLGARPTPRARAAMDAALVLVADHELNVSSFAARVVASSGADLYAGILAALSALGGPRHGGACDRIEALLRESELDGPKDTIRSRARRGEAVPGFGHPLYPDGDPRSTPLLGMAKRLSSRRSEPLFALVRAARAQGLAPPTVDLALVALARALDLPPGSAAALFAVGRVAGWVAHFREQRQEDYLLRPRAQYIGP
jgi:citrate synthase